MTIWFNDLLINAVILILLETYFSDIIIVVIGHIYVFSRCIHEDPDWRTNSAADKAPFTKPDASFLVSVVPSPSVKPSVPLPDVSSSIEMLFIGFVCVADNDYGGRLLYVNRCIAHIHFAACVATG